MNNDIEKTPDYFAWIGELKQRYRSTQIKAAVAVNTALLEFYWNLGKDISEKYPGKKRNAHFFAELSCDLKAAIPEANGLSERNIKYMLAFYRLYSNRQQLVADNINLSLSNRQQLVADENRTPFISQVVESKRQTRVNLQQVAARLNNDYTHEVFAALQQVPWGHHIVIMSKCGGDVEKAMFYVRKTIENGWSRNVLAIEIDGDLYARQGKAVTNFALTMPEVDSDLAQQLTKDPYIFEVQGLAEQYRETELTDAMCNSNYGSN